MCLAYTSIIRWHSSITFLKNKTLTLAILHSFGILRLLQHIFNKCNSVNLNNVPEYFRSSEFIPSKLAAFLIFMDESAPSSCSNVESTPVSSFICSAASWERYSSIVILAALLLALFFLGTLIPQLFFSYRLLKYLSLNERWLFLWLHIGTLVS